jgi:aspartate carbamoyltransferase catalytic subunit
MTKAQELLLFVVALSSALFAMRCATVKSMGPKMVHLAAEDCVEIATGDVRAVCATVDELVPLLDLIMARRIQAEKKSMIADGGVE